MSSSTLLITTFHNNPLKRVICWLPWCQKSDGQKCFVIRNLWLQVQQKVNSAFKRQASKLTLWHIGSHRLLQESRGWGTLARHWQGWGQRQGWVRRLLIPLLLVLSRTGGSLRLPKVCPLSWQPSSFFSRNSSSNVTVVKVTTFPVLVWRWIAFCGYIGRRGGLIGRGGIVAWIL